MKLENKEKLTSYEKVLAICTNDLNSKQKEAITNLINSLLPKIDHVFKLTEIEKLNVIQALEIHINQAHFNSFHLKDNDGQVYGVGMYPTIALTNHSCHPNITTIFEDGTATVFANRSIAAEEPILNNYGWCFFNQDRTSRRDALKLRYDFDCMCIFRLQKYQSKFFSKGENFKIFIACVENWPVSSSEGKTTCYPKKGIPTSIFNQELHRSYEDRIKCFELLEKGEKLIARKLISTTIKRLEQFINFPDQDLLDLIFIGGLCKENLKNSRTSCTSRV